MDRLAGPAGLCEAFIVSVDSFAGQSSEVPGPPGPLLRARHRRKRCCFPAPTRDAIEVDDLFEYPILGTDTRIPITVQGHSTRGTEDEELSP